MLNLETLEQRRLTSDLTLYYKIFHNLTPWDPSEVFTLSIPLYNLHSVSHSFNIRKPLCRIKIYENHFFNRCISAWNSLPSYVVESKSLTLFKRNLKIIDLSAFLKYVFQQPVLYCVIFYIFLVSHKWFFSYPVITIESLHIYSLMCLLYLMFVCTA